MWSTHQKIFYLTHSFLQYKYEISLMETFLFQGKFTDSDFKFLSLFLFNKIIRNVFMAISFDNDFPRRAFGR